MRRETSTEPPVWPWRVALVPIEPEPARGYTVTMRAERSDGTLVTAGSVRGGYVEGRIKLLHVTLEDACLDVDCGTDRCQGGACVDPLLDVEGAPDLADAGL